jgi:hypothetical protein
MCQWWVVDSLDGGHLGVFEQLLEPAWDAHRAYWARLLT